MVALIFFGLREWSACARIDVLFFFIVVPAVHTAWPFIFCVLITSVLLSLIIVIVITSMMPWTLVSHFELQSRCSSKFREFSTSTELFLPLLIGCIFVSSLTSMKAILATICHRAAWWARWWWASTPPLTPFVTAVTRASRIASTSTPAWLVLTVAAPDFIVSSVGRWSWAALPPAVGSFRWSTAGWWLFFILTNFRGIPLGRGRDSDGTTS